MTNPTYEVALSNLDLALKELINAVPPPQVVLRHGYPAYRCVEQTIEQAIVLKLVRYISGLRACLLLLEHGFVQELGTLQRAVQDIEEDVTFLSLSIILGKHTDFHTRFLASFWKEEFDTTGPRPTSLPRDMVPRSKIRAYNADPNGLNPDPSTTVGVVRTVSSVYSGFVHAAACHIMDLYGGHPPTFHTDGLPGTIRQEEHDEDLWNQFYRGILLMAEACMAFGHQELNEQLRIFAKQFAAADGRDYTPT